MAAEIGYVDITFKIKIALGSKPVELQKILDHIDWLVGDGAGKFHAVDEEQVVTIERVNFECPWETLR